MLYLIGLGLRDEKDISLKGLEAIKACDLVYFEGYTSKLECSVSDMEKLYGKSIIIADRNLAESGMGKIISEAESKNVAFLVIGDVFSATTHISLFAEAKSCNVKVEVIHNASVLTAVGITGLELYKFGKITSIPFDNKDIVAPIDVFEMNKSNGLHTLFLLDLNPEKGDFMTAAQAAEYLIQKGIPAETDAVACAELGSKNPGVAFDKLRSLNERIATQWAGRIPQCLIIPGKLHFVEQESLERYQD
jgi:diphthine synthase